MRRLKYTIFLLAVSLLCLFSVNNSLIAQSMEVRLDEVKIMGSRKSISTTDLHTVKIDSTLRTKYFGSDLAQILKGETNLNITQYGGEGSLASIRMRGSAPSQTQINWNGIPVNSPTTGSIDLSLLSGGMADAIEIAYGASGSLFGNGTFGGSINLFNKPDWNNRIAVNLAGEAGSWNHVKTGASIRVGNDSWQYHLTGLYQSSPNTYPFRNTFKEGNPIEYRMNDSMKMMSFQQHLFFRLANNWYLQYGGWIHSRDKQLPAAMSSAPIFTSFQKDQSIRQFARVTKLFKNSSFELAIAFLTDSLLYAEKTAKTDSVIKQSGIRSTDTYLSLSHRWSISDYLTMENGADLEYQTARVQSYSGLAKETRGAVFSLLKFMVKQFSANISYRQVFYSMTGPKPLFSTAFQYQMPSTGLSVKCQISNKFRFPTLNDRYWQPGGNPGLLPETGLGYDLGINWESVNSSKSNINLSSLLFIQQINNWIQWVPTGTYWTPRNIRQVKCQGLELSLTGRWKIGTVGLTAKTMYTYTESLDMKQSEMTDRFRRQLPYVPFHLLKIQSGIDLHRIEASLSYKYSGRRFTTDNHDPWLDLNPYHLVDLSIGYTFLTKKDKIILTGNLFNLFNASYQLIRAYPTPGRSFYLSVNYLFNQNIKRND